MSNNRRCIINVATTPDERTQQNRLKELLDQTQETGFYWSYIPAGWPAHRDIPYAFKACALNMAALRDFDTLLWVDVDGLPSLPLAPIWERIERDGYWFKCDTADSNAVWCADAAYPILFPELFPEEMARDDERALRVAREISGKIPHLSTRCFGLSMKHECGHLFLPEYHRLATETLAFRGPSVNAPQSSEKPFTADYAPCGPCPLVKGHHHDATAASFIAWRLRMQPSVPMEKTL